MTTLAFQKGVTEAKVDYELKMTEALAASRNLSAAAQELVSNIKVFYFILMSSYSAKSATVLYVTVRYY